MGPSAHCTPMIEAGVALATSSVTALLSAFACARPAALRTTRCRVGVVSRWGLAVEAMGRHRRGGPGVVQCDGLERWWVGVWGVGCGVRWVGVCGGWVGP